MKQTRVIVIGAGAAGLTAAVSASRMGAQVLVLEHMDEAGKKLLLTGAGRCNITNSDLSASHYHGDASFAEEVIRRFTTNDCLDLMHSIGLETKGVRYRYSDSTFFYPDSERAWDVREAFLNTLSAQGVRLITDCSVRGVKREENGFFVETEHEELTADRLIIACGSNAAPSTGSDSSMYPILKSLQIPMMLWLPALTPLRSASALLHKLAGIRADAKAVLIDHNDRMKWSQPLGEVQFTRNYISGVPVLQLSRYAAISKKQGHEISLQLSIRSVNNKDGKLPAVNRLELQEGERYEPSDEETMLTLPISGAAGFDRAQCCSGGADTSVFDPATMECKSLPGLFLAGEVLNVDGDCGGYNLHFAFGSGVLAGRSAAK